MMFVALLVSLLVRVSFGVADIDVFDLSNSWDFSDFIRNGVQKKDDSLGVAKPFVLRCALSQGICLQSAACPWDRMLLDQSEWCTHHHNNLVCCHVARVRTPINLFLAYD